jgi:predicted nucleotidyltransferase
MPFTHVDEPLIVARIERDLRAVHTALTAADPGLRSLVLTGSFARGEGAVLDGVPQNDYDFVAVRGANRPKRSYAEIRDALEEELGLHLDLAPIWAGRLPYVRRSIFWYETRERGRTIGGIPLLHRIRRFGPHEIDRAEAFRLLTNRAAGLLHVRIQASKALLAAMDAHLLARGVFPPTQTERMEAFQNLVVTNQVPAAVVLRPWMRWAFSFKTNPAAAEQVQAPEAWNKAARALCFALPKALRRLGAHSVAQACGHDPWVERWHYYRHGNRVLPGGRLQRAPSGYVRAATWSILTRSLAEPGRPGEIRWLDDARHATLQ